MTVDLQKILDLIRSIKPLFMDHERASHIQVKGVADFVTQVDFQVQELIQQGWNLEEVLYDDMYHYYMFVYDTEKQLVRPAEDIRYYAIDWYAIHAISPDELRLEEGTYSGDYRLVIKDGVVECILDHWLP